MIGTSFITLAVVCAAYAVFAAGIFFGPSVAGRALRTSIVGGAGVLGLVLVLLSVEVLSTEYLGVETPYFTVLALVVAAALYGPFSLRVPGRAAGGGSRTIERDRLLRVLGEQSLTARPAASGVHPALADVTRALDVTGLTVAAADGSVVASEGVASGRGRGHAHPADVRRGAGR